MLLRQLTNSLRIRPGTDHGAAIKASKPISRSQKSNIYLRPAIPSYAPIEINITPQFFSAMQNLRT